MKNLFLCMAMLLFLSGPALAQDQVGADQKLNAGIKNYETFGWISSIDKIPDDQVFIGNNGVVVFNNATTRSKIKDAIMYELISKGYKFRYFEPDMLVSFYVTEQPGELTVYNGYELYNSGFDTTRTADNIETINVKPGTLLISLIDRKSGEMVWRGYANDALNPDMVNSAPKVMHAVASIFQKFDYTAKK